MELRGVELFAGLDDADLDEIVTKMTRRAFAPGEFMCREGEPGSSLLVISRGLARVDVSSAQGAVTMRRLRRGDVIGELSLMTGEPRSADVRAVVATEALELDQGAFATILSEQAAVASNLTRILSGRLARAHDRLVEGGRRGEAVGLVVGRGAAALVAEIVDRTRRASPRPVEALGVVSSGFGPQELHGSSVEGALSFLDDLLDHVGTGLVVTGVDDEQLSVLMDQMDRIVIVADEVETAQVVSSPRAQEVGVEVFSADVDTAWLGRHLARTKLGLVLGAGGAKGFAHVGALAVLEAAGVTIDYVAGSSIGALVGACVARGMDAAAIGAWMRGAFTPDNVAELFKLSLAGTSVGAGTMERIIEEVAGDDSFEDLALPLVVMTVDLNSKLPFVISEGAVKDALVGATALAGMFPPLERDGRRLIDALALVPVPVGAAAKAGADVTIAVNIMSRDELDRWPGDEGAEPAPAPGRSRMLDTFLEVMDLFHVDASVRGAAEADVVVTPRFGPATWRDFHLADRFEAAGRAAATEQLASLFTLVPQPQKGGSGGTADVYAR